MTARRILLLATAISALTGCGSNLAEVTGKVTVGGQPLLGGNGVRATILFQPAGGSGVPATGIVDANGEYRLASGSNEGIVPGDYAVTCTATQLVPSKTPGGTPSGRRISDPKYANAATSGLTFTVQPGDNRFDVALDSPKKK